MLAVLALASLISGCAQQHSTRYKGLAAYPSVVETFASQKVTVVAHRGCWKDAPENSIAALRSCIAMGVDMAEIDIRTTADGSLILMHDGAVGRTTDGEGLVEQYTLKEITQLHLRSGKGGRKAPVTDHKVATLAQALAVSDGALLLNLDIKQADPAAVFAAVTAAGAERRVLFKSGAPPADAALVGRPYHGKSAFMPVIKNCPIGGSQRPCAPNLPDAVASYGHLVPAAYEIVFDDAAFLQTSGPALAASGMELWVNSLYPRISGGRSDAMAIGDPGAVWGSLIEAGASIIQTDEPAALLAYLARAGLR
ncbi:MAG: glycerophosphodiester phosphodiesterase family protein [Pseudomonadota bacterium]